MSKVTDPESYFYPTNPHTKTREEVIQAEVFDPGFQLAPGVAPVHSFTIEKTHSIVPRWRDVCRETIDILKNARINWVGIECFRRRQLQKKSNDLDDATVVITVREIPPITDDVNAVLGKIHELSGGLFVELDRGRIWPQCDEARRTHQELDLGDSLSFATQPLMGGSIGVRGNSRTGTLGGYLELFKEGVVKPCGLTCAHVVSNPREKGQESATEMSDGSHDRVLRVCHPSERDYETTTDQNRAALDQYKWCHENLRKKPKNFVQGSSDSKTEKSLEFFRSMIEKYESAIDAAVSSNPTDREVGMVSARSVTRVLPSTNPNQRHITDWAIIDMKAGRSGTNMICCPNKVLTATSPNLDGKRITEAGVPEVGSWVSKVGRTTKTTDGVVNSVESCLRYDETGKELRSMEFAVVANNRESPFCRSGDSGAFVMCTTDENPVLVGLLWGGMDDGMARDKTYFTPIKSVAKDILDTTGYHVRLPDEDRVCICC